VSRGYQVRRASNAREELGFGEVEFVAWQRGAVT
jgi:hypothetical protein